MLQKLSFSQFYNQQFVFAFQNMLYSVYVQQNFHLHFFIKNFIPVIYKGINTWLYLRTTESVIPFDMSNRFYSKSSFTLDKNSWCICDVIYILGFYQYGFNSSHFYFLKYLVSWLSNVQPQGVSILSSI